MAKRNLKKKSKPRLECKDGKCYMGCDLTKLKAPCEHLEALLPQDREGDSKNKEKLFYKSSMEHFDAEPLYFSYTEGEEEAFKTKLRTYGLVELDVDILVDVFVNGRSLLEIKDEYGFKGVSGVYNWYKRVLNDLKERKYK